MKVLIIGCGAVGLAVAASLYQAGEKPDLVARGRTAAAVRSGGIERCGVFPAVSVPSGALGVFESAKAAGRGYDLILNSAKTTGNAEIAADLASCGEGILAPGGLLVLFQNGFGNERAFRGQFDEKRICLSSFAVGFERPRPNVSEVTVFSSGIRIGNLSGGAPEPARALAKAIAAGGIPAEATDEIAKTVWAKLLYNCALNPLSALLRVDYGGLARSESSLSLIRDIIRELFAVMHAAGYETFWKTAEDYEKDFFGKIFPPTYGHRSSTLQDMERKISTEIDSLNGAVVRLGAEHGVQTPVNATIVRLVKAAESVYAYRPGVEKDECL